MVEEQAFATAFWSPILRKRQPLGQRNGTRIFADQRSYKELARISEDRCSFIIVSARALA
jgi:hypothetical protein